MRRGALIVFEGCDNCGKTTQSKLLVDFFKSQKESVIHLGFPNRQTNIGIIINSYLHRKELFLGDVAHLLFAANRFEHKDKIVSLINSGTNVIVDRYSYSGVAYSVANGLDKRWSMSTENGLPRPDIVFYMKEVADTDNTGTKENSLLKRVNFGDECYENDEFQTKVSQIFDKIYQQERHYWHFINANRPIEIIHKEIKEQALQLFQYVEDFPLEKIDW